MEVVNQAHGRDWVLYHADSTEVLKGIPDNSVGLSVFSPPFGHTLYVYSASDRDLGNSRDADEFMNHYQFIIRELLRVTKPGRLCCVHCSDVPTMKSREGVIGVSDFPGDNIRWFQAAGWTYYGRWTVDKDPQAAAITKHSIQLAFHQMEKDSCRSAPVIPDFVCLFRKEGENPSPVRKPIDRDTWVSWARNTMMASVWYDIRQTYTLNASEGRDDQDGRHICLARGSLVLTREDGYIPIEDVDVGDRVLTHTGRWMPVTGKRCNWIRPVVRVCAQGVADLRVTPDHKIWTRDGSWVRSKEKARRSDPEWVPAQETLGSYINLKLPPVEEDPLTEDEWWIVGRWLGDGHRCGHKRSGKRGGLGQFVVSCAHTEASELIERLGDHAGHAAAVTATQIALRNLRPEVRDVLGRCGKGAAGKCLPGEAVVLCPEKAEALLAGYLSADGYYIEKHDRWSASSVSRSLLLGMALIAQRARGVVASVYAGRPGRSGVIGGRTVQMHQDWILIFRNSPGYRKSGWIQDDGAWKKVRKIGCAGENEVWDISVAHDASFTVEGAVVKNCPLQLDTIERCIRFYSNTGDVVLDPFSGIGSTGYQAIGFGRRFVGVELKDSYYATAVTNLRRAEAMNQQKTLFDGLEEEPAAEAVA